MVFSSSIFSEFAFSSFVSMAVSSRHFAERQLFSFAVCQLQNLCSISLWRCVCVAFWKRCSGEIIAPRMSLAKCWRMAGPKRIFGTNNHAWPKDKNQVVRCHSLSLSAVEKPNTHRFGKCARANGMSRANNICRVCGNFSILPARRIHSTYSFWAQICVSLLK